MLSSLSTYIAEGHLSQIVPSYESIPLPTLKADAHGEGRAASNAMSKQRQAPAACDRVAM